MLKSSLRPRLIIISVSLLIIIGAVAAYAHLSISVPAKVVISPTSAPGEPGNVGDEAKSQVDSIAITPTAAPIKNDSLSTTPLAIRAQVESFIVTPQDEGRAAINTSLRGISSGACNLTFLSPTQKSVTAQGQVSWDGRTYYCSFGRVTGIIESGLWNAKLEVADAPTMTTSFKVGP